MTNKPIVLLTGINGYIASVTAKTILDSGLFAVRGTVRKLSSAEPLITGPLKRFYEDGDFDVIVVKDITAETAFDGVMEGVTAIAHLATPVSFNFTDPEPVLHAAVQGTKAILQSATKEPGLKTVIFMSSILAVLSPEPSSFQQSPHIYSEKDWNSEAEELVKKFGKETPGRVIYSASKTAAERAFWRFREVHEPKYTMTAVNPVFTIGPPLLPLNSSSEVSVSLAPIWDIFCGEPITTPAVQPNTVDVRDVAKLVLYVIEHAEETDGERYIAASARGGPQAIADILRSAFPGRRGVIREGVPGEGYNNDYGIVKNGAGIASSKARKLLGGWIGYEESVVDTARAFERLI
ncbi:NAD(P)-binding protein [Delitschia confertaspora ATCC 74209]|uniref:NAD(P)-binding protein n=1 Tax=Delitschia confertaspora ATCC 74209 TaxID=1513339 RepID=A0A9P4MUY9_9PLEO|nr:NAD(P)-binding protein [Delitschia confertaspora ATCC 74209]